MCEQINEDKITRWMHVSDSSGPVHLKIWIFIQMVGQREFLNFNLPPVKQNKELASARNSICAAQIVMKKI